MTAIRTREDCTPCRSSLMDAQPHSPILLPTHSLHRPGAGDRHPRPGGSSHLSSSRRSHCGARSLSRGGRSRRPVHHLGPRENGCLYCGVGGLGTGGTDGAVFGSSLRWLVTARSELGAKAGPKTKKPSRTTNAMPSRIGSTPQLPSSTRTSSPDRPASRLGKVSGRDRSSSIASLLWSIEISMENVIRLVRFRREHPERKLTVFQMRHSASATLIISQRSGRGRQKGHGSAERAGARSVDRGAECVCRSPEQGVVMPLCPKRRAQGKPDDHCGKKKDASLSARIPPQA